MSNLEALEHNPTFQVDAEYVLFVKCSSCGTWCLIHAPSHVEATRLQMLHKQGQLHHAPCPKGVTHTATSDKEHWVATAPFDKVRLYALISDGD